MNVYNKNENQISMNVKYVAKKTIEENESAPADEGTGKWPRRQEPAENEQTGPVSLQLSAT